MGSERKRLDVLLVDMGLFTSRSAARAAVMAGLVMVDGAKAGKPGVPVPINSSLLVRERPRYVSRGGFKLEKALRSFKVDMAGRVALDVGASTGGFTDCLLQHGAAAVYAVDVGYGQMDWRLRQDERVVLLERTNIRSLTGERLGARMDFAAVDVSFISLRLVLPVLRDLGVPEAVALVKPQFEAGKDRVGKKGVVRDPKDHIDVLRQTAQTASLAGYVVPAADYSPLRGPQGNIEFLIHLKTPSSFGGELKPPDFAHIVALAHQQPD